MTGPVPLADRIKWALTIRPSTAEDLSRYLGTTPREVRKRLSEAAWACKVGLEHKGPGNRESGPPWVVWGTTEGWT